MFELCDWAFKEHTLSKNRIQNHHNANWSFATRGVLLSFFPGMPLVNVPLQQNIFSVLSAYFVVLLNSWKPVNTEDMFGKSVTCKSLHSRITNISQRKGNVGVLQLTQDGLCAGTVCFCSGMSASEVHWDPLPTLWCERSQILLIVDKNLQGKNIFLSSERNNFSLLALATGAEKWRVSGWWGGSLSLEPELQSVCSTGAELLPKGQQCMERMYWNGTKVSFLPTRKNIGFYQLAWKVKRKKKILLFMPEESKKAKDCAKKSLCCYRCK